MAHRESYSVTDGLIRKWKLERKLARNPAIKLITSTMFKNPDPDSQEEPYADSTFVACPRCVKRGGGSFGVHLGNRSPYIDKYCDDRGEPIGTDDGFTLHDRNDGCAADVAWFESGRVLTVNLYCECGYGFRLCFGEEAKGGGVYAYAFEPLES